MKKSGERLKAAREYLGLTQDQVATILNTTSSIITVSEFSKKDICEYFNYPEEKVYVTQLAAEEMYKPLDKHYCKKILKKRYSIDTDFILYVGGFSPRKNILGLNKYLDKRKKYYYTLSQRNINRGVRNYGLHEWLFSKDLSVF